METEPIKIESYKCPSCGLIMNETTYEKARQHTSMPVDSPLPLGFIFRLKDVKEYRITTQIPLNVDRLYAINQKDHSIPHQFIVCSSGQDNHFLYDDSREIKKGFQEGMYEMLSKEEYEKFKRDFDANLNVIIDGHHKSMLNSIKNNGFIRDPSALLLKIQ